MTQTCSFWWTSNIPLCICATLLYPFICRWWTCLQGSNGEADMENRIVDTVGEAEGGTDGESGRETWTLPCVKWQPVGIFRMTPGTQTSVLCQPGGVGWSERWDRGSRQRGCMSPYAWFMLIDGRSQHNIVKRLSFNLKEKKGQGMYSDKEDIPTCD